MKRLACILAPLLLITACSGSTPQIVQEFWQRNYRFDPSTGLVSQEMSLFLHVNDDDGFEDLESIFLIADGSELFWEITKDSWIKDERQGEIWIGTNRLSMVRNLQFPAGDYRIILIDKAGERSRSDIFVPTVNSPVLQERFPRLSVSDEEIRIGNGNGLRHIIWFYNAAGELVKSFATAEASVRIDTVLSSREIGSVTEIYLYREEANLGVGLITGPVFAGR